MGVDTDVLLRVRDRAALREALRNHAARDRQKWIDDGNEAAYDALVADGYDPQPLIRPMDDGSVSIFTGLRFKDQEMELAVRCWLHEHFGDALSRIHDDPRGVFVSPDICEPRARTYDGIIAELKNAGRFVDPRPPTKEEMETVFDDSDDDEESDEDEDDGEDAPPIDASAAIAMMRQMMGLQEGGTANVSGNPLLENPGALSQMFAGLVEQATTAMANPTSFERVAMLLPPVVAKVIGANPPPNLDVQERIDLADGSAIFVTSHMETGLEAATIAEALAEANIDRAAVGPLPFFRESLVQEAASKPSFAEATTALGDRIELLPLRTWKEKIQDDKRAVSAWLEGKS